MESKKKFINLFKKFRYFNLFVLIGFLSIIFEILILNFILKFNFNQNLTSITSLLFGIIFAFYLNFFFNFKIHKSKIIKAFIYFVIISLLSWSFQKLIGDHLIVSDFSYEIKRIITSGLFFIFAYFLHRKFSFKDYKKVGIAFYLTKNIKLNKIFKLIKNNSNFIHVDIVDKSFSESKVTNELEVLKDIKKIWPNKEIEFHIMSKYPLKWTKKIIKYADTVYIHYESLEKIDVLRKYITQNNKKFGIAITLKTKPNKIINILKKSSALLILAVDNPGFSGQSFNDKTFGYIDFFNKLKFRNKFRICIDGGVNKELARVLEVDDLVSNSSILGSKSPILEINNFKYSNF